MGKILKQDTKDIAEPVNLLMVKLLFQKEPKLCPVDTWKQALQDAFGEVETVSEENIYMMSILNYQGRFMDKGEEKRVPVLHNMLSPSAFDMDTIDELKSSQFWDVPNAMELLKSCTHNILMFDMMSISLEYPKRIDLAVRSVEAALRIYEDCVGVYVEATGKFLTREQILDNVDKNIIFRFLSMYVNVRFFNIQDSEDQIIDSLGLYALGLADVQMHFHGLDPNAVVNHVYNIASYQLEHDVPIKNNETVDGFDENGRIDRKIQWTCRYESSLIQPIREVLDIEAGSYAAGTREN